MPTANKPTQEEIKDRSRKLGRFYFGSSLGGTLIPLCPRSSLYGPLWSSVFGLKDHQALPHPIRTEGSKIAFLTWTVRRFLQDITGPQSTLKSASLTGHPLLTETPAPRGPQGTTAVGFTLFRPWSLITNRDTEVLMNSYDKKVRENLGNILSQYLETAEEEFQQIVGDLAEYVQAETKRSFINGLQTEPRSKSKPQAGKFQKKRPAYKQPDESSLVEFEEA